MRVETLPIDRVRAFVQSCSRYLEPRLKGVCDLASEYKKESLASDKAFREDPSNFEADQVEKALDLGSSLSGVGAALLLVTSNYQVEFLSWLNRQFPTLNLFRDQGVELKKNLYYLGPKQKLSAWADSVRCGANYVRHFEDWVQKALSRESKFMDERGLDRKQYWDLMRSDLPFCKKVLGNRPASNLSILVGAGVCLSQIFELAESYNLDSYFTVADQLGLTNARMTAEQYSLWAQDVHDYLRKESKI